VRTKRSKYWQKPVQELTPDELQARDRTRAERAEQQKADAPVAMREYREAEQVLRDRTMRLRAERLAREASVKA
jgi:hypothetical protein